MRVANILCSHSICRPLLSCHVAVTHTRVHDHCGRCVRDQQAPSKQDASLGWTLDLQTGVRRAPTKLWSRPPCQPSYCTCSLPEPGRGNKHFSISCQRRLVLSRRQAIRSPATAFTPLNTTMEQIKKVGQSLGANSGEGLMNFACLCTRLT